MENWSNYKLLFKGAFLTSILLFSSFSSTHQKRWGFVGHKRINRMASFTLPPSMFGFFKEHLEYLTEHAVDPDKRRYAVKGEAQCHYIDIDHYAHLGDPFAIMPQYWKEAVEKFSEDTLQAYGIVPWHIVKMKYRLQKAFEEKNVDLILKYSADLGHYIGDAHVPLHTTENYNGQLTGQKGIHGLWESRLVEINEDNYDYLVGKADYIPNLTTFIWKVVKESNQAVDSVLSIEKKLTQAFPKDRKYTYEKRGKSTVKTYSTEFSQQYHSLLNNMVERRLRSSIHAVGSIWYTAWVDAGQPDLGTLQNKPVSAQQIEEWKKLDQEYENGKSGEHICD